MAELKARHVYGNSADVQAAIDAGIIDAYDICFLDEDTGKPNLGWINRNGEMVALANAADVGKIVVVEELPETGEAAVIYILANKGYVWSGTEFIDLCKPPDSLSIDVIEF